MTDSNPPNAPKAPRLPAIRPELPTGLPRLLLIGGALVLAYSALNASMFRIRQNEVGFITRFGKVLNPEAGPIVSGLHFKIPMIDEADRISTSTDTYKVTQMRAFTRDTQEVSLQVSITYTVPAAAAYHLLYEIGRSGNVDIHNNIEAIANDRVRSIVSRRDVTELAGEGREKIVDEIKAVIASELKRLFRVDVQDVQIPLLDFSPQYKEAVNRSTLARAQRLQAEQDRERAKVEAETVVVRAQGEADSQYARAEGQARANLTQAKAEAEATKLRGEAEASAIAAKIAAAGGVDGYAKQTQAQASLYWKGEVPRIVLSGGGAAGGAASATQIPIVIPMTDTK